MKFLFTSYAGSPGYSDPVSWLKRIEGYTGILEALAKWHEVISIEHISYEGIVKRNGVTYRFVNFGENFHRSPAKFHRLIHELEPDVVFINGFNFPMQIISLRMKLGNKPAIMILNRAEKPFTNWKKWLQKLADRCVTAYLFASDEFAVDWKKNISTEKIHEIVQASSIFRIADKKTARTDLNLPTDDILFLWVGALIPRKDPMTIVKSFIEFSRSRKRIRLYMIYQSGELLPEITSLIEKENAEDQIRLVGEVEHPNLGDWYNSADFFVSGSHYEGNGVAAIEGMSCGCVPVLSNITSFRRMTGPGKCGFLFEPGNTDDLLKQLVKATESDHDQERSAAIRQFEAELSFDAIAKKINCITGYKDQCQPHPSNPGLAS